jgi:hypothetical protein
MELQLTTPAGIHLVSVSASDRAQEPRLIRGIVYAFAIQGAAAIAFATSWMLLRP